MSPSRVMPIEHGIDRTLFQGVGFTSEMALNPGLFCHPFGLKESLGAAHAIAGATPIFATKWMRLQRIYLRTLVKVPVKKICSKHRNMTTSSQTKIGAS